MSREKLIKVSFKDDTRRYSWPKLPAYSHLRQTLGNAFSKYLINSDWQIKYIDEENDCVTISSDNELEEAWTTVEKTRLSYLRLYIEAIPRTAPPLTNNVTSSNLPYNPSSLVSNRSSDPEFRNLYPRIYPPPPRPPSIDLRSNSSSSDLAPPPSPVPVPIGISNVSVPTINNPNPMHTAPPSISDQQPIPTIPPLDSRDSAVFSVMNSRATSSLNPEFDPLNFWTHAIPSAPVDYKSQSPDNNSDENSTMEIYRPSFLSSFWPLLSRVPLIGRFFDYPSNFSERRMTSTCPPALSKLSRQGSKIRIKSEKSRRSPYNLPTKLDRRALSMQLKDTSMPSRISIPLGSKSKTQVWLVRNDGPCFWPAKTRVSYVGGDKFHDIDHVLVEEQVYPGDEVEVSVNFNIPPTCGRFTSYWRFATDDGMRFGKRLLIDIVVIDSL